MQSILVFLDIAKFADYRWKIADASRTQGVGYVIYIFFRSSLAKANFMTIGYVWRILGSSGIFAPSPCVSIPKKDSVKGALSDFR